MINWYAHKTTTNNALEVYVRHAYDLMIVVSYDARVRLYSVINPASM